MKFLFGLLALVLSFCSLSYQFLMVKMITPFIQNEVLSQSLSLGFFLLAMGAGSYFAPRLYERGGWLGRLSRIEFLISLVVLLMSFLIYAIQLTLQVFTESLFWTYPLPKLLIFQFFTLLVGFLSGLETPFLFYMIKRKNLNITFNFLLAFSYIGAVMGSFATAFFFNRFFSPSSALILVALLNCGIGCLMVFIEAIKWKSKVVYVFAYLMLIPISLVCMQNNRIFEQMFLKAFYYDFKLEKISLHDFTQHLKFSSELKDVERIHTPYQIIDILPAQERFAEYLNSDWSLYLDHQPQFTLDSASLYHETMVVGAMNLNKSKPANILILGGGDGLVAKELLKFDFVKKIDLVELDEVMLNLSNADSRFVELNKYSLSDSRVSVIVGDAYKYIKLNRQTYDAVFVDFPFPVNFELSRLYSVEFYKNVYRVLAADGFMILDLPLKYGTTSDASPQVAISRTVYRSGFSNLLMFGPLNPFLFSTKKDHSLKFDYAAIGVSASPRTIMNLIQVNEFEIDEIKKEGPVNSIYKPMVFR